MGTGWKAKQEHEKVMIPPIDVDIGHTREGNVAALIWIFILHSI